MDKAIRDYLARIGAKGGKRGGKAQTPAQRRAAKRNLALGPKRLLTKRLCRVCRKNRLGSRNRSGVCRVCQRKGKSGR